MIPVLSNLAANFTRVSVGDVSVWFSYETPVAFSVGGAAPVVRQNDWSNTTGRHMAQIDGGDKAAKAARIPGDDFLDAVTLATCPVAIGGRA